MRRLFPFLVLLAVAAPAASLADGGIVLNARAGVAKPFGDLEKDSPMSDLVAWEFPLQADLQFRVMRPLSVGAYVKYGPTTLGSKMKDACSGMSCKLNDIGFGAIAEWRLSGRLEGGPWVGAFFGYDMLKGDLSEGSLSATASITGFEGGANLGMDFELGGLTLGPYAGLSAGQFTKADIGAGNVSITDKTLHYWFQVGLRASLLF
jgi:hypothetical protein